MPAQVVSHDQEVMLQLISIIMTLGMQLCHLQCYWHHVMTVLAPVESHNQKSNVAPHFDYLDLRNAMVLFSILLDHVMPMLVPMVSHDLYSHIAHYFDILDLRYAVVPFTKPLTSHDTDANANGIT